ncbi:MAG: IPTL-CTERM sorting domain-containing protein [Cellvibrionaceae bacterium]|nr:IPTL-CTERM sorting domain-containing protein [Cellvibrionaceae bacterium]MCV6624999.1 IPTL-CTERM sorting domain-containing protein [Cellvibrionaceae bacterium]
MKRLILFALAVIYACQLFAQEHFAVSGERCSTSNLYAFDPETPSATLIGATGLNGITGIDIHPQSGILYGVVGGGRCNAADRSLVTIDKSTGVATTIASLSGRVVSDISFNAAGTLYAFAPRDDELITIDINTGASTTIGSISNNNSAGLSFDSSGALFMVDDSNLYQLNPADASVLLSASNPDTNHDNENIAFVDKNDRLITSEGGTPVQYFLFTDKVSGAETSIGYINETLSAVSSFRQPLQQQQQAVPTLSSWGLGILAGLMGLLVHLRQRKAKSAY